MNFSETIQIMTDLLCNINVWLVHCITLFSWRRVYTGLMFSVCIVHYFLSQLWHESTSTLENMLYILHHQPPCWAVLHHGKLKTTKQWHQSTVISCAAETKENGHVGFCLAETRHGGCGGLISWDKIERSCQFLSGWDTARGEGCLLAVRLRQKRNGHVVGEGVFSCAAETKRNRHRFLSGWDMARGVGLISSDKWLELRQMTWAHLKLLWFTFLIEVTQWLENDSDSSH